MSRRIILVSAATVLSYCVGASPSFALEATPSIEILHRQGFGLVASWLSGSGFAYRRWTDNGWGFQVAGVPYIAPPTTFVNAGAQVMAQFLRNDKFRAYGLAGVGVGYFTDNTVVGIPVGAGVDWFLNDNLSLTLGLGYTLSSNHPNRRDISFDTFTPGPSVGVMLEW